MKGTADVYAPKVVRAATGSLFRMPVVSMASTQKSWWSLPGQPARKSTATCLDAQRCYYDEDLTHDIALVIGNEGSGVAPALIELRTQDQNTHAGQYRIAERRSGGRRADV